MDWSGVARNVVPLSAIAAVTLTAATVLFRKRMEQGATNPEHGIAARR